MSRRKKKAQNTFYSLPEVEIKLSNDEIVKDIQKYNCNRYPAFSIIIDYIQRFPAQISRIVCLGIGDLCVDLNARKQLSFVLGIQKAIANECKILFYDPITCSSCCDFLVKTFPFIEIDKENRCGQYDANGTLFITFHVPFFLLNNILCHNMAKEKLKNFILIGNSFVLSFKNRKEDNIIADTVSKSIVEDIELDFCNDETFDQTHLMVCNRENIEKVEDSFWSSFRCQIMPQESG